MLASFANEWLKASGNNVCIVFYDTEASSSANAKMDSIEIDMIKTKRHEYVAKMARDLVYDVREKCIISKRRLCLKNLSQVDVSGFSFGKTFKKNI